jgi:hypothetical protein
MSANNATPSVGLVGDLSGPLAQQMKDSVNLSSYTGSTAGLDAVLIDGNSAAAGEANSDSFQTILEAGKALLIANPGAQALEGLKVVTRQGPGKTVALLGCAKVDLGSGRSSYCFAVVPAIQTESQAPEGTAASTSGEPTVAPDGARVNVLAMLADLSKQRQRLAGAAPKPIAMDDDGDGGDGVGLRPPDGATWGIMSQSNTATPASAVSWTHQQTTTLRLQFQGYVYYVDGGPDPPYYLVIVALSASANRQGDSWIPILNYAIFFHGIFLLSNKVDGSRKLIKNTPPISFAHTQLSSLTHADQNNR